MTGVRRILESGELAGRRGRRQDARTAGSDFPFRDRFSMRPRLRGEVYTKPCSCG